MPVLKYGAALFPSLVWLAAWLTAAFYKSASEGLAYVLVLAGLVAAITSFPVVVVAFIKLRRGMDTPWVVVSLVFSLPVFILSVIAVTAMTTRADTLAFNRPVNTDARASAVLFEGQQAHAGYREC